MERSFPSVFIVLTVQSVFARSYFLNYFLNYLPSKSSFVCICISVLFLFPVSCSNFCLACFWYPCPCPVSVVFVFFIWLSFQFWVCGSSSQYFFYPVYCLFGPRIVLIVIIDILVLTPISCLADYSLAFCLCTMIYLITWLVTPVCLLTLTSACRIKPLIFFTLHLGPSPKPHITTTQFTSYATAAPTFPIFSGCDTD